MASCTAFCVMGENHHDMGMGVHHLVRLYENGSAALVMEERLQDNTGWRMLARWRCLTPDTILDELMLMGAAYALKDEAVRAACLEAGIDLHNNRDILGPLEDASRLKSLFDLARAAYRQKSLKAALITLHGSTLGSFRERMKDYAVDLELCPSEYTTGPAPWF